MPEAAQDAPESCLGLVINRPEWFRNPEFVRWIEDPREFVLSAHRGRTGEPDEYADTVVLVDPECNGDGTGDGGMPHAYWREIVSLCAEHLGRRERAMSYMVRITNLD